MVQFHRSPAGNHCSGEPWGELVGTGRPVHHCSGEPWGEVVASESYEPTYKTALSRCPDAVRNPATGEPVSKKRVYEVYKDLCYDEDPEEQWSSENSDPGPRDPVGDGRRTCVERVDFQTLEPTLAPAPHGPVPEKERQLFRMRTLFAVPTEQFASGPESPWTSPERRSCPRTTDGDQATRNAFPCTATGVVDLQPAPV